MLCDMETLSFFSFSFFLNNIMQKKDAWGTRIKSLSSSVTPLFTKLSAVPACTTEKMEVWSREVSSH